MDLESTENDFNQFTQHVTELIENEDAEVRRMLKKREEMAEASEKKQQQINQLEMEKSRIEAEIMSLRLQDKAYQREHTNLRNAITIIKFQIGKIKESIEETKKSELEDLKEFEKAVDEITQKFRASPGIYDRRSLSRKLDEEKERRKLLLQKIQEKREALTNFNKEKGLRERSDKNEEILDCVLPGSDLYYLIQSINNLDVIINELNQRTKNMDEMEKILEGLDVTEITAKIAASKEEIQKSEAQTESVVEKE